VKRSGGPGDEVQRLKSPYGEGQIKKIKEGTQSGTRVNRACKSCVPKCGKTAVKRAERKGKNTRLAKDPQA